MPPNPDSSLRITLPPAPQKPARREFPLVATAAPVVGSIVMWVVTGSPFALVFAVLGPVVAVGSLLDSRRHGRRNARAEAERFQAELEVVLAGIEAAHRSERAELFAPLLLPRDLLTGSVRDPEWWRHRWGDPLPVCLGTGAVPSGLDIEHLPVGASPQVERAHAKVLAAGSLLTEAPIVVDARYGIGIVGPAIPAMALARAVASQLAFRLSPADSAITADAEGDSAWCRLLPHPFSRRDVQHGRVEFHAADSSPAADAGTVLCVVAADASALPRECRVLIRLDGAGGAALERNPSGHAVAAFRPWFVSEAQATVLAQRATAGAQADGLVSAAGTLPDSVSLSAVATPAHEHGGLPAAFAVGSTGEVVIDLVRDGPHAVVGGTTGSGKSELLVSWVLALATACSPRDVNFLLVDFKGGSSFAAVSRLPHTVGLITDLDQEAARRALLSLQAELRHRERVLASAGARSLDELPPGERMPRLVILVDEFAVVASEFPDLQALFADLAGRGRSLGIHLVLCTQRPAGVIRDSVLANCSLRLSLRVNNAADSVAVVGVPDAASLPVTPQGRCLVSVSGAAPVQVQVALAEASDAERVGAVHNASDYAVRRPWCEPLPAVVPLERALAHATTDGLVFGLADLPELQQQPAAVYDPHRDGNLVVLGGLGSGKTGALDALHEAARLQGLTVLRIPPDLEGAWDAIGHAVAAIDRPDGAPRLCLIDDVDAVLARLPTEYQLEIAELLTRLLREGPSAGIRTVVTAARATAGIQSLVSLCDSRLILRMPNRQEHALAGGDGGHFEADLPPGAGTWRGHRVQIGAIDGRVEAVESPTRAAWPWDAGGFALVASGTRTLTGCPLEVVDIAAGHPDPLDIGDGARPRMLIGDVGEWQSSWGLFTAVRGRLPIVFSGCSTAELRALTGSRQLPPPIGAQPGAGWVLAVDGTITRVQLPPWFTARPTGQ